MIHVHVTCKKGERPFTGCRDGMYFVNGTRDFDKKLTGIRDRRESGMRDFRESEFGMRDFQEILTGIRDRSQLNGSLDSFGGHSIFSFGFCFAPYYRTASDEV